MFCVSQLRQDAAHHLPIVHFNCTTHKIRSNPLGRHRLSLSLCCFLSSLCLHARMQARTHARTRTRVHTHTPCLFPSSAQQIAVLAAHCKFFLSPLASPEHSRGSDIQISYLYWNQNKDYLQTQAKGRAFSPASAILMFLMSCREKASD